MNSEDNGRWWTITGKHGVHVSHLLSEKTDLIFGTPEALRIKYDGTVQLAEGQSVDAAAREFWEAVERIRPPTMAAAAVEKLSAQIGQAIFGEPVTDLIELANRCNRLRMASGGKCITQTMDDAAALMERDMGASASRRASSDVEKTASLDLDHAAALLWNWHIQLEGHVYDARDVARSLTSNGMQAIGVDPKVVIDARHKNEAVLLAMREILRALAAREPVCSNCNGVGLIPYTSGQTAETFEQGEYPCPDCAAREPVGEVVTDDDAYQRGYNDGYGEGYGQRATDSTQPVAWRGFCSDGVEFETDREHCEANPDYWQALYAAPPAQQHAQVDLGATFQAGVSEWMAQCFVPSLYSNMTERGDRLLEETLELLQAHNYDPGRVATLVRYVYSRPVGAPAQEVGGVMVTLAGYCWIAGLDMHAAGDAELRRITQPEVMAKIRAKQEAKNALHFDTLPGGSHG